VDFGRMLFISSPTDSTAFSLSTRVSTGSSAYAVKVIPESKYIYIAGERLKLTSIKSYVVYREGAHLSRLHRGFWPDAVHQQPDRQHRVFFIHAGLDKSTVQPGEMRSVKKLAITTFQGTTLIFSEDEIDAVHQQPDRQHRVFFIHAGLDRLFFPVNHIGLDGGQLTRCCRSGC
jgi:hypothetical protein